MGLQLVEINHAANIFGREFRGNFSMSRKKPLSLEEKMKRMLDLLQEKDDFFNQKELEKLAPKEKGIVPQSVREVLDILVSDGTARTEKVGASNYYWSFKSDARVSKENRRRGQEEELEALAQTREGLREKIKRGKEQRQGDPKREKKLGRHSAMKAERERLAEKIKVYKENDPQEMEGLREECRRAIRAANVWTENIFSLQSFLTGTYNMSRDDVKKGFSIPDDLEELPGGA
jgi:Mnd1 HTH domain/Leucine zipper with capping helix domain